MSRLFGPIVVAAAFVAFPALAQTPPTQPPQNKPPASAPPPQQRTVSCPPPVTGAVPLPVWFKEVDTANKGEVTREQFLKYRMKTFEQLDTNHDGKLSIDEFLKVAEPPFSKEGPGVPPLAERQARARAEFQNLDTNRNGFVERAEAEALVHAEFNQYDTDRDNKVTEPELRLIVQAALQRDRERCLQAQQQSRRGLMTINEFIDMQLRSIDQLDKNGDGRISQQEWLLIAGPPDGPQAQGLPPYELRKKIALVKFQEIDTNKDGVLDRVEVTAHAVTEFQQKDLNKDHYISEEEWKKSLEAEQKKVRALVQTLQPAPQTPPRPAPAPAQPRGGHPQQQPQGLAPGLPQGTH